MLGTKKLNDVQLIEAIKKGDRNALIQLYRDNYLSMKNYVLNNNGRQDDAEDVLQDACIVVWEKTQNGEFILTSKLSTFVFSVSKNLWLKKLNKQSKNMPIDDMNHEKMSDKNTSFDKEKLHHVKEMIQTLGEKCQSILTYFYFDGLDMSTIANILNYNNADTAKAKKHQCFKQLQESFLAKYDKTDFL